MFLAAGNWSASDSREVCVLPWSPLKESLLGISEKHLKGEVKRWAFRNLSSLLLLLDSKARELLNSKWPNRCPRFLATGEASPLTTNSELQLLNVERLLSKEDT